MKLQPKHLDQIKESEISTTKFLPKWSEIPEEFKQIHGTKWNDIFSKWFFTGLRDAVFVPKEGFDRDKALRFIKVHMRSCEPKHEHKEAGVAYMMSQLFEDIQIGDKE